MLAGKSSQALNLTWETFSLNRFCLCQVLGGLHHISLLPTKHKTSLLCAVEFGAVPRIKLGSCCLQIPLCWQENPAATVQKIPPKHQSEVPRQPPPLSPTALTSAYGESCYLSYETYLHKYNSQIVFCPAAIIYYPFVSFSYTAKCVFQF